MILRPYQDQIIEDARALLRSGARSVLIQSPTASGKTAITAHMLAGAAARRMLSWFIVHRRELIKQSVETFNAVGVPHGIISAGFAPNPLPYVQLCSVGTLSRRLGTLPKPRMIVWDECHHIAAKSWSAIHAAYPEAIHIGLSATPGRLDGKGLGDWFKSMVRGPSVAQLIADGWLAPFRIYAAQRPDLTKVHRIAGDYNKAELAAVMNKPVVTGNAITEYQRLTPGKRAILRTVSIEHSLAVAAQFRAAGIPAIHVDGDTPAGERDLAMASFRRGETLVLCNVDLFSEGVDVPAVEAAFDLRPTESLTLALQFWGRVLRPAEGKPHAVICDLAGNVFRHGFPDDDRAWSLEGRPKRERKAGEKELSVRTCGECYAALPSTAHDCRYCGYVFPIVPREVKRVEGELSEVDREIARQQAKARISQARSLQELVKLGQSLGYKNAGYWSLKVFNSRRAR